MKVLDTKSGWMIRCEACNQHCIPKDRWKFNGDLDSPTFTPSINETCNPKDHKDYRPDVATTNCHFVITAGKIHYVSSCTHDLKGQTLVLRDWDSVTVRYYEALKQETNPTASKV